MGTTGAVLSRVNSLWYFVLIMFSADAVSIDRIFPCCFVYFPNIIMGLYHVGDYTYFTFQTKRTEMSSGLSYSNPGTMTLAATVPSIGAK